MAMVQIKKLRADAVIPTRGSSFAAGCDLYACLDPETVCGTVQNINREGETAHVMTLGELKDTQVDMFTTVFIGNSQTRNIDGKMVTPRGYKNV